MFTVTRTPIKGGRFAYAVNGITIRTSSRSYDWATPGTGNPYHPSGLYLGLHSRYNLARKNCDTARAQMADGTAQAAGHDFTDMTIAEVIPG